MEIPEPILNLLKQLDSDERRMPPTVLYNEGWMLRLVLNAGSHGLLPGYMKKDTFWFSEVQLRTPFGRARGPKSESNTHADGVVGNFELGADTRSGLELSNEADQFIVFEAKMYSPLSSGTKHAPGYDQVARTVACMAYTLQRGERKPANVAEIGFYVLAPDQQIRSGIFDVAMTDRSIRERIEDRIQQFSGTAREYLETWRDEWAWPLLKRFSDKTSLKCISWESLIQEISGEDAGEGALLRGFYEKCKEHNLPVVRALEVNGRPTRGLEYYVRGGRLNGTRVRVCSVGKINSRAYVSVESSDTFLVQNMSLEAVPEEDQQPAPPDPLVGQEYSWNRPEQPSVRVCVRNVGDCNSRVISADGLGNSFKVPNHQLRPANNR